MNIKAFVVNFNGGNIRQVPDFVWNFFYTLPIGQTRHLSWAGEKRQVWRDKSGCVNT